MVSSATAGDLLNMKGVLDSDVDEGGGMIGSSDEVGDGELTM